jgi:hypothetical protein
LLVRPTVRLSRIVSLLRVTLRLWASCALERVTTLPDAAAFALGSATGAWAMAGAAAFTRCCTRGAGCVALSRMALFELVMTTRRAFAEGAADFACLD